MIIREALVGKYWPRWISCGIELPTNALLMVTCSASILALDEVILGAHAR